jgi:hypothetical protein
MSKLPTLLEMDFNARYGERCYICDGKTQNIEIMLRTLVGNYTVPVCYDCVEIHTEKKSTTRPSSIEKNWKIIVTHCQICDTQLTAHEKNNPVIDTNEDVLNIYTEQDIYSNIWMCCSRMKCRNIFSEYIDDLSIINMFFELV